MSRMRWAELGFRRQSACLVKSSCKEKQSCQCLVHWRYADPYSNASECGGKELNAHTCIQLRAACSGHVLQSEGYNPVAIVKVEYDKGKIRVSDRN